ncbi:HNH endonuclease signature motif containing protein [Weissella paramesenteroides]|uniref:HNH endonuclease signature motif containing protein n=1 Tax=Weissella paramesenteroides TaxID=1249 RepID=UPI00223C4BE1|nr:HNH endonuclease signature motif containing protein [Weissella paramesenteroides]
MLKEIDDNLKGTMREAHLKRQAQAKYDEEVRDTDATSFYHSKRWVRLSKYVKVKQGYSSQISGRLLSDDDCQVDHIVKRSLLSQDQWYDTDNLWLISRHEHSIKTAIETNMLRDGKSNVLKHLDKKWWTKVINEKINDSNN